MLAKNHMKNTLTILLYHFNVVQKCGCGLDV